MGARGLFKMVVALFAVIFGSMALVGEGPQVAMGSDDPQLTSTELAEIEASASPETVSKSANNPTLIAAAQASPAVIRDKGEAPAPVLEASLQTGTGPEIKSDASVQQASLQSSAQEVTSTAKPLTGVVLGTRVNVRSGPSTSNGVIGQVTRDQELRILGYADNGWARILLDGEEGYMSGNFLREVAGG